MHITCISIFVCSRTYIDVWLLQVPEWSAQEDQGAGQGGTSYTRGACPDHQVETGGEHSIVFHLRQKVFTSDKKFSPQMKSFHVRQQSFHLKFMYKVFFPLAPPFQYGNEKRPISQAVDLIHKFFLEYQLWLTKSQSPFVTESEKGQ